MQPLKTNVASETADDEGATLRPVHYYVMKPHQETPAVCGECSPHYNNKN
jgi:hypothetical protein